MKLNLSLLLIALGLINYSVIAADIAAGKAKATMCVACHGQDGISLIPIYPNLKGQNAAYTEKQLLNFKNKIRKDPVMSPQAAMLSEEDIKNIAAYYESLKDKK